MLGARQQLEEWDKELNELHEKNGDLNLQVQTLETEKKQLQNELERVRSQFSAQACQQEPRTGDLPDAATLLNRLKSQRKKSKADFADVEVLLGLLGVDT